MSIINQIGTFEKVISFEAPTRKIGGLALGKSASYRYVLEGNDKYSHGLLRIFTGVTARGTYDLKNASNVPDLLSTQHPNGLTYYNGMLYACAISHHICRMKLDSNGTSVKAGAWYETEPNTGKNDEIGAIAHLAGDKFLVRHHNCNFGVYQFKEEKNKYMEISNSDLVEIGGLEKCLREQCPNAYDSKGLLQLTMNDIDYQADKDDALKGFLYLTFWDEDGGYDSNGRSTCNYIVKVRVVFKSDYSFMSMNVVEVTRFSLDNDVTASDRDLMQLEVEGIDYSYSPVYFTTNGSISAVSMNEPYCDARTGVYVDPNRDGLYKFISYQTETL